MTPERLLGIARRWFALLVLGVIVPSVVTFLFTSIQPQVFQVSATLLPAQLKLSGNPNVNTVSMSRLVGLSTNYAFSAKSQDLLSTVRQQLNLSEPVEDLAKQVDANVDQNTGALTITARAGDASAATALANAVARAIESQSSGVQTDKTLPTDLGLVRTQMLATEAEYQRLLALPTPRTANDTQALENSLTLLGSLTNVYDSLNASLNQTPTGLIIINEADAALAQEIAPRTLYYTLLAAVAGLLIAAAIASLLEYVDDTVKSPEDVEEVADLRVLGAIERMKGARGRGEIYRLAALLYPRSGVAESYRMLRTNIEFASLDGPIRTLLVTSSAPGDGKTVTAANLAVVFAQAGRRVLLVDADLRKPGVHQVFDLPNSRGLTTFLGHSDEVSLDLIANATEQANLRVLTSGPLVPNPAELLGSQRMRTILDRLKAGDDDLLIFDSPPLELVTDSAILGSYLDRTLLVIDAGRSRRRSVSRGRDALVRGGANILGVVLNRVPSRVPAGYADYYRSEEGPKKRVEATGATPAGRSVS